MLILVAIVIAAGYGLSRIDFGETIAEITLPLRHEDIIRQQAEEKGVDAELIAAVIYAESRFRDQTSTAGARGLMQITPETGDTIENLSGGETFVYEDLGDPDLNIRYGTFYLATSSRSTRATRSPRWPPTTRAAATSTSGVEPRSRPRTSGSRRRATTSRRFSTSATSTARTTRTSSGSDR